VFRYLLRLPDGDPADPPALITAVPNWDIDEVFQTGDGSRWRILWMEPEIDPERAAWATSYSRPLAGSITPRS
jgi:hypothetical protein